MEGCMGRVSWMFNGFCGHVLCWEVCEFNWVYEFMSLWVYELMSSWVCELMSLWVCEFMSLWVYELTSKRVCHSAGRHLALSLTTYSLLHTPYYTLLTAYFLLHTSYCILLTTYSSLLTTYYLTPWLLDSLTPHFNIPNYKTLLRYLWADCLAEP